MAISTNGIKTSYLDATPISGRMSIPRRQENAQAMRDDFDLGEPRSVLLPTKSHSMTGWR